MLMLEKSRRKIEGEKQAETNLADLFSFGIEKFKDKLTVESAYD